MIPINPTTESPVESESLPMVPPPDWYRSYFSEPYGEIYADYLLPPDMSIAEARFAVDALHLEPHHWILDCPCGFGRHMQHLLEGHPHVVGLDLDADCLRRASRLLPRQKHVRADMRRIPFRDGFFDAVVNLFNSFGYFPPEENEQVLMEFARLLRPMGRVLIDMANLEPLVDLIQENPRTIQQIDDLIVHETWAFSKKTQILMNETEIDLRGRRTHRSYAVCLYTLAQMEGMLQAAGFRVEGVFGDFDGEEYDPVESPRLIITALR